MKSNVIVSVMFTLLFVGCRSVWVHENASGYKFSEDRYLCRYGEARPTEDDLRLSGEARSQGTPDQIIKPEVDPPSAPVANDHVNTGSGTNVNVNVATVDARRRAIKPIIVRGHKPRRPSYEECMDILGWWPERRSGSGRRWAPPQED